MPAGVLVTVPLPVPAFVTASAYVFNAKFAVTLFAASTVTTQEPVPVQPLPLQQVKVEPAFAAAANVTTVPLLKFVEQVAPQLMPAGVLVTVPLPVPVLLTIKAMGAGPRETTKATVEPEVADAPAAGF